MNADRDYNAGMDGLQEDMAAHQLRVGKEPTAEANKVMAADAIQRLENQDAESKPAPVASEATPIKPSVTRERKEVDGRAYLLKKETTDSTLLRKASAEEAWFLAHAMPRVELLLSKPESGALGAPSWRDRVLAAMGIQAHAASLRAAAEDPEVFARQRRAVEALPPLEKNRILKTLDITGVSDLTPGFAKKKAAELDRKYLVTLCAILEDSSVPFGDWKKDAPAKVAA